jgi:hypothetical protein
MPARDHECYSKYIFSLATCRHSMLWFAPLALAGVFLAKNVLSSEWIDYPASGYATMTHYTIPSGYIAACGCTGASTDYPIAALSQMAFGSSANYGTF